MAKEQTRTYKVLKVETAPDGDGSYEMVGEYVAADPRGAIRGAIIEHGFGPTYVAVAESAWHEETPKAKPTPAISWS